MLNNFKLLQIYFTIYKITCFLKEVFNVFIIEFIFISSYVKNYFTKNYEMRFSLVLLFILINITQIKIFNNYYIYYSLIRIILVVSITQFLEYFIIIFAFIRDIVIVIVATMLKMSLASPYNYFLANRTNFQRG